MRLDHLWENTLGGVLPTLIYPQLKRGSDILAALLLAPLVALIIGVCAAWIKLDSPGPIFYRQRRTGLGGRPFTIFKLRTMTPAEGGEAFTSEGDSRITRVGQYLRRYRLDELPQIINIFRGEMSWIGPRPEAASLPNGMSAKFPSTFIAILFGPALAAGHRCTKAMSRRSRQRG